MDKWGLGFDKQLLSLTGRILPVERILQGPRSVEHETNVILIWSFTRCRNVTVCVCVLDLQYEYDPSTADWSREMRGLPIICSPPLDNWLLLFTRRNGNEAQNFLHTLNRVSAPMGIRISRPMMYASSKRF